MKPFSDGEFVKDCLMEVVDVLIPEKRSLFSNSLSRRTVTRRIEELAEDLKISLRTLAGKFELYSLAGKFKLYSLELMRVLIKLILLSYLCI